MAKRSRRMRGRHSISDAPGGSYGPKWHEMLTYITKPKKGKLREVRIAGGFFVIFQHYVKFRNRKNAISGYYELCPNWNWETGEFRQGPDATCPICADFNDRDLPEHLRMFGSFRYYFDAFDVTMAKGNGGETIFGVAFVNKYGKNDLASLADILGNEVDDEENGISVHWFLDENAKDAKDRMRFHQGQKIPIRYDEDRGLYLMKGGKKKIFKGEPTDFAEIITPKSGDEIKNDLQRNGCYRELESYLESQGDDDISADVPGWGDDGEEAEEEKPKRKPRSSQKKSGKGGGNAKGKGKSKPKSKPKPKGKGKGKEKSKKAEEVETPPDDDEWGSSDEGSPGDWDDDLGDSGSDAADEDWGSSSDSDESSGEGWDDEGSDDSGSEEASDDSDDGDVDGWGEASHDDSYFGDDDGDDDWGSSSDEAGDSSDDDGDADDPEDW